MQSDPSVKVREALGFVFNRICEHHFEIFSDEAVRTQVIPCLMKSIQDKPRISNHACAAISYLAEGHAPLDEETLSNCLSHYYQEIIQILLHNSTRLDSTGMGIDLRVASYSTITALVQNSCTYTNDITNELLMPTLQQLE